MGGEFFTADIDQVGGGKSNPFGFYAWSQYQFNRNTYLGVRYDFTEDLTEENLETNTLGLFLTYYTTEFLRFRLGYEHSESDIDELDAQDTGLFEVNFVFGSHPVEPYWINR